MAMASAASNKPSIVGGAGDIIGEAGNSSKAFLYLNHRKNIIFVGQYLHKTLSYAFKLFINERSSAGLESGRKETVLLNSVQEMWEKSFREIGEDNPEHTVTGIIIFYPTYLIAYCEVSFFQ